MFSEIHLFGGFLTVTLVVALSVFATKFLGVLFVLEIWLVFTVSNQIQCQ